MDLYIILLLLFASTFGMGIVIIPHIIRISKQLHLYDLPDSRKVHKIPVPRTGGLVFLPIVTLAMTVMLVLMLRLEYDVEGIWKGATIQHFLAYIAGAMMLFSIGLYDDVYGVGYRKKFVIQILSAVLLCISGLWVADFSYVFFIREVPFWVGVPVTVLSVVYLTNAMNLIDGIDGLASGLTCISLAVIAFLNIVIKDVVWAMFCIAFLGVVMAFFYYNVFNKEQKVFMGDAGSLTLGFTLSFLILHFWQRNPVWNIHLHNVGIIALSTLVIPMFDVVRVMMSRIRDGRNPFLPDKNHIHHKLMRTGLSGRMTMVTILLLSCGFVLLNYFVAAYLSQTLMVILDVMLFCVMHIIINVFIAKKESKTGIKWGRVM